MNLPTFPDTLERAPFDAPDNLTAVRKLPAVLIEGSVTLAKRGADAARMLRTRAAEYNRNALENSDPWLEAHIMIVAGVAAGIGLMLGTLMALPG